MRSRWIRPQIDPVLIDAALATAVILVGLLGLGAEEPRTLPTSPVRWVFDVAIALPVLFRRRYPEAALAATALIAALATALVGPPGFGSFLALLIGAFTVGARSALAAGLAALALTSAVVVGVGLAIAPLSVEGVVIPFVYLGGAWILGRLTRALGGRADRLEREAERLARERDERARLAVAEERTRIARELHDVVAHAVTTMVLQAEAATAELAPDAEGLRNRLAAIGGSGRQALDELRRVLAVLRDPRETDATDAPAGLDGLGPLVEQARAAGLAATITVDTDVRRVPPSLELTAYRIVQEALTNVLKHARASAVSVTVGEGSGALQIEVRDDGIGSTRAGPDHGGGHGLVGMRERVAMFGGSLSAGPAPEGGFAVVARLPIPKERA